jgi:TPR repeat protein
VKTDPTDPNTTVEIRAGDRLLNAPGEEVQDGRRFALLIPPKTALLTVRLRRADGTRSRPWSLALAPGDIPAWYTEIRNLRGSAQREGLQRLARSAVPPNEQGLRLWALALQAQQEGNDGDAAAFLRQGIAVDQRRRDVKGEWKKRGMLARIAITHSRFAEARHILSAPPPADGAPADAQYQKLFYQGALAGVLGDYRLALQQLRLAADQAERIGDSTLRWKTEELLAQGLQSVGRSQDAAELFGRLRSDPHPEGDCDLGELLINQAWTWQLAREGGEEASDPIPVLQEARDFAVQQCEGQRLDAGLNLALAYQQAERWPDAKRALEEIRPLTSEANLSQHLWWLDLKGRQAIAEGRPAQALELYSELSGKAGRALSLEGGFRAAVGRARARLATGDRAAAIDDLAAADRLIDEQTWLIPADAGRDTFLAQREAATRLYLDLLLKEGQRQRAFALARRARSRLLRQLVVRDRLAQLNPAEQRRWDEALSRYWGLRHEADRLASEEWQVPVDQRRRAAEDRSARLAAARNDLDTAIAAFGAPADRGPDSLTPPRPGEVILVYHPLPQGWAGFAAHAQGIEVARFSLPSGLLAHRRPRVPPEVLSLALLAPFRSVLVRADRVRVLPYGLLQPVDFHALPLDGEPLLARHIVTYSLDLGTPPSAPLSSRPTALLVADSEGNLPAARQEAAIVGAAIRSWGRGWSLKRLDGPAAQAEAVSDALPGSDLFHFAGHGNFSGLAGWDSALRLADNSQLTLSDLLALRRVPAWVVLSACESGQSSGQAPGEGVGLAQAFLLAGAQGVIASTRTVDDRKARDLIAELYRGWQPGADLARQLQRAQLACMRRDPASVWASFRLLEP